MKKLLIGLIMLAMLSVGASANTWIWIGVKANFIKWIHQVQYEWRVDEDGTYLCYGQYSLTYKLSKNFYLGTAYRELNHIKSKYREHRPMLNFTAESGEFKNRSRISWRAKDAGKEDHWRFRNKTTWLFLNPIYIAYEIFVESNVGLYRHRTYAGIELGRFHVFYMEQTTDKVVVKVLGVYFTAKF